jgi:CIC family chloride channel protein
MIFDVLKTVRVGDVVVRDRPYVTFERRTPAAEVIQKVASSAWQDAFPVVSEDGKLEGIVSAEILRTMAADPDLAGFALADDMMTAPLSVNEADDLHVALEAMLTHGVRELLVIDDEGRIIGFLDEAEITRNYHGQTSANANKGR